MKLRVISIVIGAHRTISKVFVRELKELEIEERAVTIQTTDLKRLAVTQTPVKDHQLMLMWKTHNE